MSSKKEKPAKKEKLTPWRYSQAKLLLYQDIVDGDITDDCDAEMAYGFREEFQAYEFKNFKNNLKTLRASINKNQGKADNDLAALLHDMAIRPPRDETVLVWHKSKAKKLLKKDINEGLHNGLSTIDVWRSRNEYQRWESKTFIKHYHQEINSRKQSNYWDNVAKKKKRFLKKITEIVAKPDSDDEDDDDNGTFMI